MGWDGGISRDGRGICVIGLRGWTPLCYGAGRANSLQIFLYNGARIGLCPPALYVFTLPLFTLWRDSMQ